MSPLRLRLGLVATVATVATEQLALPEPLGQHFKQVIWLCQGRFLDFKLKTVEAPILGLRAMPEISLHGHRRAGVMAQQAILGAQVILEILAT